MLFNGHVPPEYWVEAFSSAVYIINRLPTPVIDNVSPFEVMFSTKPTYTHLRAFACRVYPYLRDYATHKLSPRSLPCVFLGYSSQYKGFRCLDPITSKIYISRHAQFEETEFPFSGSISGHGTHDTQLVSYLDDPTSHTSTPTITQTQPTPQHTTSPHPIPHHQPTNITSQTPTHNLQQQKPTNPLKSTTPYQHQPNTQSSTAQQPNINTTCGLCIDP